MSPSADFWREKWREGRIGFHRSDVQPALIRYAPRFLPSPADRVFVPLCGKTHDLVWLADQGREVVGVEIVPEAVRDFFREQDLSPESDPMERYVRHRSGRITILEGDIFDVAAADLGTFPAIYDRAALIAIATGDRPRYARLLLDHLRPGGKILLFACTYDASEMDGPPYSVTDEEVMSFFADAAEVELLEEKETLAHNTHLANRGLTWLRGSAYLITRRS